MKEYGGELDFGVENGHDGLYFIPGGYDIEPKNMENRVRVFIEQLLPGIVQGVSTPSDIKWSFEVLGRHAHRFGLKLIEANMPEEYLKMLIAVNDTVGQILVKQQEMFNHDKKQTNQASE